MLMAVDRVVAAARLAAVEMGLMEVLAAQDQIRLYLLLLPWGLVIDLMRTHQFKDMTGVLTVAVDLAVSDHQLLQEQDNMLLLLEQSAVEQIHYPQ
jgi:hypothetical protein